MTAFHEKSTFNEAQIAQDQNAPEAAAAESDAHEAAATKEHIEELDLREEQQNETLGVKEWIDRAYEFLPEGAREVMKAKSEFDLALQIEALGLQGSTAADVEASTALLARMGENSEKLLDREWFVTDIAAPSAFNTEKGPSKLLDGREVQEGKDVAGYGGFVREKLARFAPPELAETAQSIFDDYLGFVEGKKVFTRSGIDSAYDLTHDYFLTMHIAEERASRDMLSELGADAAYTTLVESAGGEQWSDRLRAVLDRVPETERAALEQRFAERQATVEMQTEVLADACERIATSYRFEALGKKSLAALPMELQIVVAEHPEAAVDIMALQESGAEVCFADQAFTDPGTLEAMQEIGVKANANYQTTWLHNLVVEGKTPPLERGSNVEKDLIRYKDELYGLEKRHAALVAEAAANPATGLRRRMRDWNLERKREGIGDLKGKIEDLEDDTLTDKVQRITDAVGEYKTLGALRPDRLTDDQRSAIERFNTTYLRDINVRYADEKMQFDISNEQTAEAQDLLRKLALLGPVAQQLESSGLGELGKFIAGTGDDVLNEMAEIKALKGQGFTMRQIVYDRWKMLAAGLGGASALATLSEKLYESGNRVAGGATFGLGAVGLSLISCSQSIKMFRESFDQLLKEGKVGGMAYLEASPEFKDEWERRYGNAKGMTEENVTAAVRATFDSLAEKDAAVEEARVVPDAAGEGTLLEQIGALSAEDIRALVMQKPAPDFSERYARGEIDGTDRIALDPKFKETWKELFKGSHGLDTAQMVERVRATYAAMHENELLERNMPLSAEERERILDMVAQVDPETVKKAIGKNASLQAWKQAIIQDFNHPARLGIFLGALAAPGLGAGAGALGLLHNGFVTTAVGGGETYGAFAAIMTARLRFNARWRKDMRRELARAKQPEREADEPEEAPMPEKN